MTDDEQLWLIPLRSDPTMRISFEHYLATAIEHEHLLLEECPLVEVPIHRGAIGVLKSLQRLLLNKERAHGERAKYDRATGRSPLAPT